jgi:putative transposase
VPSAPEAAEQALAEFEGGPWGQKYSAIGPIWRRRWSEVIPFFAFSAEQWHSLKESVAFV